ncbi:MAG: pectinesterase family protein [Bacteroidota bacterium]|nr:pectinesterase family protein [Bacteroidota bacterium]
MKHFLLFITLTFSLTTFAQSKPQYDFIVALDGSGDFKTVQEAINAVPDYRKVRTVIFIKKGTYKEKIILAESKTMVTFIGENKDSTILTFDDYAQKKNRFGEDKGTSGSAGFYVYGPGFRAENITFENSAGPVGQAVAVLVKGDRAAFFNCRFLGFQDTLYTFGDQTRASRQYYKNCYIEGTVDFIFGWATAWFEGCTLHSKHENGYVTAASTPESSKYGYVFYNCRLTGNVPEASIYLGRPWRPFAKVAYLNCEMGKHIKPEGWNNWGNTANEHTAQYAEYKSFGSGANSAARVKWSRQLSDQEAATYTIANVLGGADNWNPEE